MEIDLDKWQKQRFTIMNHIRPTEVPGNGNNSLKSEGGDSRDSRGDQCQDSK